VKKASIVLILFSFGLIFTVHSWAQTPKATESAQDKKEGLESLKKLVQEIKEKKKIKVYAGTIKGILAKTISLETKNGTKTARISDQTKITFDSQSKEPKLENILVGQFAVALGEIDQSKIMTPKTLQIFSNPPVIKRKAVFGIVKSITLNSITIVHQAKGEETKINFDTQTKIKTTQEEAKLQDIKVGWKVALVGIQSTSGEILAKEVLLIPQDFSYLIKKFEGKASGSATQPATTSATY